jgi:hypothetical protein
VVSYGSAGRASRCACYVPRVTDHPLARVLLGRRVVFGTALLAILTTMGWWMGATADGRVGATATLASPVGTDVVLSLLTVLRIEGPSAYVVGNATLEIPVVGPTAGISVGEDVTVGATVEQGHVRARWLEHAPDRRAKKRLGILGLGTAAAIGGAAVRLTRGGAVIRAGTG